MDLFEKTAKLESIKNDVEKIESMIGSKVLGLAVDKLYFSDKATVSTVYVIVENGDNLKSNLLSELELIRSFEDVIFDIVGQHHYKDNLRDFAQLFYER